MNPHTYYYIAVVLSALCAGSLSAVATLWICILALRKKIRKALADKKNEGPLRSLLDVIVSQLAPVYPILRVPLGTMDTKEVERDGKKFLLVPVGLLPELLLDRPEFERSVLSTEELVRNRLLGEIQVLCEDYTFDKLEPGDAESMRQFEEQSFIPKAYRDDLKRLVQELKQKLIDDETPAAGSGMH